MPLGVGILVDVENVLGAERAEGSQHLEKLLGDLRDHFAPVTIYEAFVGARLPRALRTQVDAAFATFGTVYQAPNPDIALAVRATRLLSEIDELALVTGDGDLLPIVQEYQHENKKKSQSSRRSAGCLQHWPSRRLIISRQMI